MIQKGEERIQAAAQPWHGMGDEDDQQQRIVFHNYSLSLPRPFIYITFSSIAL